MARARGPLQLARQTRPWTLGAGRWSDALKQIASTEEAKLPESVLIDADAHTYTIYDGYPKAQFHFLILPRLPLVYDESLENGKRRRVQIDERELDSISSVLASRHASFILGCLERASERLCERIRASMRALLIPAENPAACSYAEEGTQAMGATWDVRRGFHALPSMRHVHLHVRPCLTQVLSSDLVSERLKHKKHYLSFHPHVGYWLPLHDAQAMVERGERGLPHAPAHYEALLKGPLTDLDQRTTFRVMPALKKDLERRWKEAVGLPST